MMKMIYAASPELTFEVEVGNSKDAFAKLHEIQDVFTENSCGCCESKNVRFDVREFDGNTYYKMLCRDCRAQFEFGSHREGGTLFGKRWDKEAKQEKPNRGWFVFQGERYQSEHPAARRERSDYVATQPDRTPTPRPQTATPAGPKPWPERMARIREFLAKRPDLDDFNRKLFGPEFNWGTVPPEGRGELEAAIDDYAAGIRGWKYDGAAGQFREAPASQTPNETMGLSENIPF